MALGGAVVFRPRSGGSMLEQEFVLAGDNCVVLSKMMQDGAEGPNWAKLQFIVRTMKRFQIW